MRAERARLAREQSAYIAKLQKRSGRKLSKRELAAEMRKFQSRHRLELEAARRRAEAARQAAIARQRALDDGLRNEVQANIAKDSTAAPPRPRPRLCDCRSGTALGKNLRSSPRKFKGCSQSSTDGRALYCSPPRPHAVVLARWSPRSSLSIRELG